MFKKDTFYLIAFLIIITFFCFYPSLENDFVDWDDYSYILQNYKIKTLSINRIKEIFTTTHYGGYEPLTELTFSIIYYYAKENPFYYHLINLIIHILNVILIFYLFLILTKNQVISFIVSILFAIHPLHVESVAWISELKDVLYSFFFLLSLIFYLKYKERTHARILFYILSSVFYIFSLLPKPQGLLLPFLLFIFDYFISEKIEKKLFIEKLSYLFIFTIFFIILISGYKTNTGGEKLIGQTKINFFNGTYSFLFYLIKCFLPFKLSNIYPHPKLISRFEYFLYLISPILFLLILILTIWSTKKTKKVFFGVIFYLINLLIVSQVVSTGPAVVADRYSYISLCGIFYIISEFILFIHAKLSKYKFLNYLYLAILTSIFISLCIITINRTKVWRNSYTLWNDAYKKYPKSIEALNGLGTYYLDRKEYDKAKEYFEKSVKIEERTTSLVNLGVIYENLGEYTKAINFYERALLIEKNIYYLPFIYLNIGTLYYRMKDLNKSEFYFKKAIELNPNYELAYYNMAIIQVAKKDFERAIYYYERALNLNPLNLNYYLALIKLYGEIGEIDKGILIFNKAIKFFEGNKILLEYKSKYLK